MREPSERKEFKGDLGRKKTSSWLKRKEEGEEKRKEEGTFHKRSQA